jgi:hypothetical protein
MQVVGPLVDNMVLSGSNLGILARNTIINMQKYLLQKKGSLRKPNLTRRLLIDEICSKHAGSRNGFYADLFSQ